MGKKKMRAVGLLLSMLLAGNTVQAASVAEKKIPIRILHYWGDTDNDVSARYLKRILEEDFEKEFPEVDLIQEVYDNQTYKSKIRILMAADELPDIFFGYGAGFSEPFVQEGKVLPLDEYLDKFYMEHMGAEQQKNFMYDNRLYGVGFSSWEGVLYCNRELFGKIGAEPPKTYEELVQVSAQFRNAGIQPVACGMLNRWQGQQWVNNFTIQLGGADLYNDMARGDASVDNETLSEAAQLTLNLVKKGVFCSDIYQLNSAEAEELFLNGAAAMIYIGNWFTDSAEARLGKKLEAVKMPVIPGAKKTGDYHGGCINGWMVSSGTKYPKLSTDIAAWLGYELGCCQPEHSPFVIDEKDKKDIESETAREIQKLYSDRKKGGEAWDTLMPPNKAEIWLDLCGKLFEGRVNGQEFAKILELRMNQEG